MGRLGASSAEWREEVGVSLPITPFPDILVDCKQAPHCHPRGTLGKGWGGPPRACAAPTLQEHIPLEVQLDKLVWAGPPFTKLHNCLCRLVVAWGLGKLNLGEECWDTRVKRRRLGRATTHLWADWGWETQLLRGCHLCNNNRSYSSTPSQQPRQEARGPSL